MFWFLSEKIVHIHPLIRDIFCSTTKATHISHPQTRATTLLLRLCLQQRVIMRCWNGSYEGMYFGAQRPNEVHYILISRYSAHKRAHGPPPAPLPMLMRCQMAQDKCSWGETLRWPLLLSPILSHTLKPHGGRGRMKGRGSGKGWGYQWYPSNARTSQALTNSRDATISRHALTDSEAGRNLNSPSKSLVSLLRGLKDSGPGSNIHFVCHPCPAIPGDAISSPPAWHTLTCPQNSAAAHRQNRGISVHKLSEGAVVWFWVSDSETETDTEIKEIRSSGMDVGEITRAEAHYCCCLWPY